LGARNAETSEIPKFQSTNLAFSPSGNALAGIHQEDLQEELVVWDLNTGAKLFHVHIGGWAGLLRFSNDGAVLAAKNQQRIIELWNARDGWVLGIAEGHVGEITALAFSPDGREIASGSEDGTIKLWSVEQLDRVD
jgi:WD40 repeat protein